jgi:hypothetical protein
VQAVSHTVWSFGGSGAEVLARLLATGSTFAEVCGHTLLFGHLGIAESVCKAIGPGIVVQIIEIFNNAVAPGRSGVPADCSIEERRAFGTPELFFEGTGRPRLLQYH